MMLLLEQNDVIIGYAPSSNAPIKLDEDLGLGPMAHLGQLYLS